MHSLMCVTHDDWPGALERICTEGGKVGTGESDFMILNCNPHHMHMWDLDPEWVKHKVNGKWAFQALCWEHSRMPLDVWQAGERHSNIIESLHADANREGTGCTLVGAIQKGRYFDSLKQKSVEVSCISITVHLCLLVLHMLIIFW
jgi:hypothetical protein